MQRSNFTVPVPQSAIKESDSKSCLSINIPDSLLGLANLLDLVRHEIFQDVDKCIHQLTFKSGHTLRIEADKQEVTIRGASIHFSSPPDSPSTTVLSDPGKKPRAFTRAPFSL